MPPPSGRFDVVVVVVSTLLLVMVLFVETQSSTTSTPVCPVAVDVGAPGDCRCTVLDEIQCRGLSAVPVVDVNASYSGRRTFRSLYLAAQRIDRLPAGAFAALNVRRIVLDFNPLGDRIDPRSFRGTVDLVRLGLASRRRRRTPTSQHAARRRAGSVESKRVPCWNASAEETGRRRVKVSVAAEHSRRYNSQFTPPDADATQLRRRIVSCPSVRIG